LDGGLGSGTTALCGRDAVQIRPKREAEDVDLREIAGRLAPHGQVKVNEFMLRANLVDRGQPFEITLFPDGRAIVKGTHEPNVARSLYAKFIGS
jgi:adenylyltransferase/sulfurtransferase